MKSAFQKNIKPIFNTSSSVASGSDICISKTQNMKIDLKNRGGHPA